MMMKWFEMWFEDKKSMVETMLDNMRADLDAGYDPQGHCIRKQRVELEDYVNKFDRQMEQFKTMEDAKVNRWCYYDMKKRGVIA